MSEHRSDKEFQKTVLIWIRKWSKDRRSKLFLFPDERMMHMGFIRMCLKIYTPYAGGKGISIQKREMKKIEVKIIFLFDLILYVPSTIFQLYRDGSSWV